MDYLIESMEMDSNNIIISGYPFLTPMLDHCHSSDRKSVLYLSSAFREDGIQSVFHGNKKRTPCNKISSGLRFKIIKLYRDRYFGLNLVHFIEKLKEW